MQTFENLKACVINCRKCPRLVEFREQVGNEKDWRRPVMGFGDLEGKLLILGMAPSIQGGNRTGRPFTGDRSGDFLFKVLHQVGLATQSDAVGAELINCYLTAGVKCVPPANKPVAQEFANCASYFEKELSLLKRVVALLVLGRDAFGVYRRFLKNRGVVLKSDQFGHGNRVELNEWPTLYCSYHPSPQNTQTGKLTEKMFADLCRKIQKEIE